MTALRLTPMAAPISLQVMPAAKQLLSCSIRSGVHGLVDGIRDGEGGIGTTGTIEAVATAAMVGVVGATLESDGALSNGACIGTASLCWRGLLGRRQGVCPRATGNARLQNLEAKIGARRRSISRKECPACATEPHPASRTQTRRRSGARTTD